MALCHALSLTCFHPSSFTLQLRWLHVFATITYISKLAWRHAFATLPQREIRWVMPFLGAPSLVESGVIFMVLLIGRGIMLSPHPCLPDFSGMIITFSSPDASSPFYGPVARGLKPVRYRQHYGSPLYLPQSLPLYPRSPVPPVGYRTRQIHHRQ